MTTARGSRAVVAPCARVRADRRGGV